jgi:hypothetical protein
MHPIHIIGPLPELQEPFMCDYSLHHVASRPARVSDKIVTTELAKASTRGFAAIGEHGAKLVIHDGPPKVAVCLLPGTELAFNDSVRYDRVFSLLGKARVNHKVARFRQIDLDDPYVQHDALEFPDGKILKVARLATGQTATVLQLPVTTQHAEPAEIRHLARSSSSRVALNRVPLRPGIAAILMPNQGVVMLWQTLRSTAIGAWNALAELFRRLMTHKQHPILRAASFAGIDAETIGTNFKNGVLTAPLPKKSAVPARKIDVNAAA